MKLISGSVGAVLLLVAIVLSFISFNNGSAAIARQNSIVAKYVKQSDDKLASGDIQGAISAAKLAIKANPENNAGYTSYQNALKAEYQPAQTSTPLPTPAPAPAAASSDDSMGC
jgi:hypothetical protein